MAENDQFQKIISLLETAHMLANDLGEGALEYYIERALDEARAGALFPPNLKQAPYFPG
ncbi:hypothetical protein [Rhodoplanes sp. Z2-YC6860]|uniref:hypothetical protein n=1 Tax=Rhodoplanes sp. Z2-YC6860 TaxID=674703 RepID=UPI0012ECFBA0|nr:hypothetical protein [Rhodoplanes sp. Z2-YC6860]